MPTVTITLTDTPDGRVGIASSYQPAVGKVCSKAEAHALEILARTRKQWGTPTAPVRASLPTPAMCECNRLASEEDLYTGACSACAKPIMAGL